MRQQPWAGSPGCSYTIGACLKKGRVKAQASSGKAAGSLAKCRPEHGAVLASRATPLALCLARFSGWVVAGRGVFALGTGCACVGTLFDMDDQAVHTGHMGRGARMKNNICPLGGAAA